MAGLWDRWEKGDSPVETCTVITTSAGHRTRQFHHQMPVMLVDDATTAWLDGSATQRELLRMLKSYEADDLEMFDIGRHVNNIANDSPDCILPAAEGVTDKESTTKNTKNTKVTDATGQYFLGELLSPVRPRSPG